MGYTTKFEGELLFRPSVTLEEVREVRSYLGCKHDDIASDEYHKWNYMAFELSHQWNGIEWNGWEKFYGAVEAVNWLIAKVRETHPAFTLTGELKCRGEDPTGRWKLVMKDGIALRVEADVKGRLVTCPECEHQWFDERND